MQEKGLHVKSLGVTKIQKDFMLCTYHKQNHIYMNALTMDSMGQNAIKQSHLRKDANFTILNIQFYIE